MTPAPAIAGLLALLFYSAPAAAQDPPPAKKLWTISSDDCVGVHADGEPWNECGFQVFATNASLSRVLTVSSGGRVQLWDGEGRELRRIDWADQRSGASGYPSGRALIDGNVAIAVTHHNQLLVIDLADGRILSQTAPEIMKFDELRLVEPGRLLVTIKDKEWKTHFREVDLATGELRQLPGSEQWSSLADAQLIWIAGTRPPFVVHRTRPAGKAAVAGLRSCLPFQGRFCFWHDPDGGSPYVHMLDLRSGDGGSSIDAGRKLGQWDWVQSVVAGDEAYAVICARSTAPYPSRRQCSLREYSSGREVQAFETGHSLRADGATDESGRPEVRLSLLFDQPSRREQKRIAADGTVREIDAKGRANLGPPGGGIILPGKAEDSATLVDRRGKPVAGLPFRAQTCGNGWPDWTSFCRFSADGRRWLVPGPSPVPGEAGDVGLGLTLYEVPGAAP